MGVESKSVGVRDNVPLVVMLDVLMLVDWLCDVVRVDRIEAEVLLWYLSVGCAGVAIAVHDATVPEAWKLNVSGDLEIRLVVVT